MILALVFLFTGGECRGIFENVTIMDRQTNWWKETIWVEGKEYLYWSKELFVLNKDRNGDGKATFWEKTFPNDGGHRIKVLELYLYGVACSCALFPAISLPLFGSIVYFILVPIVFWWVISFGFTLSFDKYKKLPDEH